MKNYLLNSVIFRAPDGVTSAFAAPPAGGAPSAPPAGDPPPQSAPPAGAPDWFTKMSADPDMKTWAESKGWKDPATADPFAIAQSYRNLETLFGADKAGRTVMLPKDESDKAALDAIYDKLGRPKDAKEYEINASEGANPEFIETAKGAFHKNNLTASQAKGMAEWYRAVELDAVQKVQQAHAQEVDGLQNEWKDKFDQNVETAKAAIKAAGMTDAHVKGIENALGPASAAKLFEFFGRNYIEASPPGGDTRTPPGFQNMNPAAAESKMEQLRADPNFMARYAHSDPKIRAGAIDEMNRLAQIANNAKAS